MKKNRRSIVWILMTVLVIAMALPVTVDAVNISKKSVVIKTGSKITLSMQKISKKTKVSWSSSSPKIASVKAKGQSVTVTGKKAGNSVITAKVGSKTYHCQVTVKPKLKIAIALRSVGKDGVARELRKLGASVYAVNEKTDISTFDGLILPGGGDISPSRYQEKNKGSRNINNKLDDMQFAVLDKFVKAGKPVFGVCKGIQVINVYFGGSLNQNIRKHMAVWHNVSGKTASSFFNVYGKHLKVLSYHHQSVKRLGKGLKIIQKASDGTVEAIEHETLRVYGVQYHPEAMGSSGRKILKKFLQVCD